MSGLEYRHLLAERHSFRLRAVLQLTLSVSLRFLYNSLGSQAVISALGDRSRSVMSLKSAWATRDLASKQMKQSGQSNVLILTVKPSQCVARENTGPLRR